MQIAPAQMAAAQAAWDNLAESFDDDFESTLIAIIGELEDARDYCREGMAEKARKAAAEALDMLGVAMGPDA
jgi:hypothetical protein